jgi:hypothetical protein
VPGQVDDLDGGAIHGEHCLRRGPRLTSKTPFSTAQPTRLTLAMFRSVCLWPPIHLITCPIPCAEFARCETPGAHPSGTATVAVCRRPREWAGPTSGTALRALRVVERDHRAAPI